MLQLENILLAITALVNAGLVVFIYSRDRRSLINLFFAFFALFLSFWALALLLFNLTESDLLSIYFMKASYLSALLIGVSFYHFSILFPEGKQPSLLHQRLIFLLALTFLLPLLFPGFLTERVVLHEWGKEVVLGVYGYLLFAGIFIFLFVGGLVRIWLKSIWNHGLVRAQLIAIGSCVTFAGILGMYFNLVLPSPFYQDFRYIWSGPLFTFAIAITITYSVFRFKLFNAKVVFTELITFALWTFLFVRTLLSRESPELLTNLGLLTAVVITGIFLIRSVRYEVRAREHIEQLAKDLEKANARLTELDKLKSEFVSIASHQLRSPLTAIKGYASLLLEGSYGALAGGVAEAVRRIFESSKLMVVSVEDFLNVSRIEQGRMTYDYRDFSIVNLVKGAAEEALPAASEKGLQLSFGAPQNDIAVHADLGKVKQVVTNLIDNAIKYTPQGSVDVKIMPAGKHVRIAVTDSGVGISKETMERLFDKFVRAANANEVNVSGTGLGLYVAKQLIEAQGGKIWAESAGEGKGSTFIIELPIKG